MTQRHPLIWPDGWPRAEPSRRSYGYQFKVTPDKARRSLILALNALGATDLVVSSNVPRNKDGSMSADRSGKQIDDPGVAAYFRLNGKQMVMAQDAYIFPYKNMRSLALAVEGLRAVERHGGGHMMERSFAGFAQLPPPEGYTATPQKPWREVLDVPSSTYGALPQHAQIAVAEANYRELARAHHPDKPGGSAEAMADLNVAIASAREELRYAAT